MRLIGCLVVGFAVPAQISGLFGQDVADLIVDVSEMADGSVAQARLEAQRQASSGALPFRSYAKDDYRSISGTYTPPELPEDKKGRFVYGLALFSDDGCDVTLKGNVIHQRKRQGQHLPDLGNSFHVLPVALVPGEPVQISIDYSNIIYVDDPKSPGYPDMDGATLFLYLSNPDGHRSRFQSRRNNRIFRRKSATPHLGMPRSGSGSMMTTMMSTSMKTIASQQQGETRRDSL